MAGSGGSGVAACIVHRVWILLITVRVALALSVTVLEFSPSSKVANI
jgi:hypothetical protein